MSSFRASLYEQWSKWGGEEDGDGPYGCWLRFCLPACLNICLTCRQTGGNGTNKEKNHQTRSWFPVCIGAKVLWEAFNDRGKHSHAHTHTQLNDAEGEASRVQNGLGSLWVFVSAQTNSDHKEQLFLHQHTTICTFNMFFSLVNQVSAKLEFNSQRERKKEGNDRWRTFASKTPRSNSLGCFHPLLL